MHYIPFSGIRELARIAIILDRPRESALPLIREALSHSSIPVTRFILGHVASAHLGGRLTQDMYYSWLPHLAQHIRYTPYVITVGERTADLLTDLVEYSILPSDPTLIHMPDLPGRGKAVRTEWQGHLQNVIEQLEPLYGVGG